jgi:uncharacterized protein
LKKFLRDKFPKPEVILDNRYMAWLKPWLGHPRLWHMHRQAVALGVAIGLVTGLIPGPVQMLLAVIIAIPLRANVLAAIFATLYTNPFTFIPLYMLAYTVGTFVTGEPVAKLVPPDLGFSWSQPLQFIPDLFAWFGSLGPTLIIGLAIQCTIFALVGYFGTRIIWRVVVARMWANRSARRRKR